VSPKNNECAKKNQVVHVGKHFNTTPSKSLTNKDCLTLHQNICSPALQYVLQNLCMSKDTLHHALKSTKAKFLNGFYFAIATKYSIVYGRKSWGGIGYFDSYTEQGPSKVKRFVTYIQDKSIAGYALWSSSLNMAMAIGSGDNPFHRSYNYIHDKIKCLKEVRTLAHFTEGF
jgi:hypothetical protein